jgi:hypothetical protein
MKLTKEKQLNYWREHVHQASLYQEGLYSYCLKQKISKSALYRWKKYFTTLPFNQSIQKKQKLETKKLQSPFLPVIVEASDLKNKKQIQNLPDPAWLAEVIVKVIQGLS